jgi:hypothetical protein
LPIIKHKDATYDDGEKSIVDLVLKRMDTVEDPLEYGDREIYERMGLFSFDRGQWAAYLSYLKSKIAKAKMSEHATSVQQHVRTVIDVSTCDNYLKSFVVLQRCSKCWLRIYQYLYLFPFSGLVKLGILTQ